MKPLICLYCGHEVIENDFDNHSCSHQYVTWRRPFYPTSDVLVVFVGIAPPDQLNGYFPYIYRDPDSDLKKTSLTLRNGIRTAFRINPKLKNKYPKLSEYFSNAINNKKRPFLNAIRESGVVWIDSIEYPVSNSHDYRALRNSPAFFKRCQNRLETTGAKSMIFTSDSEEHRDLRDSIQKAGPGITVTTIEKGFWAWGNFQNIVEAISKGMDVS